MEYKEFISFYTKDGQQTRAVMQTLNVFLNQVEKSVIEARNKNSAMTDKEIFTSLFAKTSSIHQLFYKESSKGQEIGVSKFYITKDIIIKFVKWLHQSNLLEDIDSTISYLEKLSFGEIVNSDDFVVSYFRDLNSVIRFIDNAGQEIFRNSPSRKPIVYDPVNDLLKEKSIAILGWYDFSFVEMTRFKKSDIVISNNQYYLIKGNNKIFIGKPEAEILRRYALTTAYRSVSSNQRPSRLWYLHDSEYLFRGSFPTPDNRLQPNALTSVVRRFNENAALIGSIHTINILSLARSNLYSKIYSFAKESPNISITQLLFTLGVTENSQQVQHRVRYNKWVATFYPIKK